MAKRFSGRRPEDQPVFTKPVDLDFEKRRIFFVKPTQGQMQISFLKLTDTPSSYPGQVGRIVGVKDTLNGLEFITIPTVIDAQKVTDDIATDNTRVAYDLGGI